MYDEDFGGEDRYLDSYWEDQYELSLGQYFLDGYEDRDEDFCDDEEDDEGWE